MVESLKADDSDVVETLAADIDVVDCPKQQMRTASAELRVAGAVADCKQSNRWTVRGCTYHLRSPRRRDCHHSDVMVLGMGIVT